MEADISDVDLGPVPPGSEAGTASEAAVLAELRAKVAALHEHDLRMEQLVREFHLARYAVLHGRDPSADARLGSGPNQERARVSAGPRRPELELSAPSGGGVPVRTGTRRSTRRGFASRVNQHSSRRRPCGTPTLDDPNRGAPQAGALLGGRTETVMSRENY